MKKLNVLALVLMSSLGGTLAFAKQTPLNISSEANDTWCGVGVINCSTFVSGSKSFDGVAFSIPTANNAWFAHVAAGGGSGTVSITIPVNILNVKTVYTLMNTFWGSTGSGLLSITFTGTGGATWTYHMTGGSDLRDYNNGAYPNTIDCALPSKVTKLAGQAGTVSAWNNGMGQRLDMQIFALPTSFAGQTLTSITITDTGAPNVQRSFLAAVTVSTSVP
jgi:hypothetical protein